MYHTTYNSNYIHVGETLHLYSKTWLFIFVVWQIISNLCSWASTSKRLVYIPSWKSIFCMQSIPNQFLPLQEAHRAALNPSESRWNSASTSSRCQTPRIGSCQHWNIFTANFPYSFFSWFASSPCHFPILWCFSSTKHEWPDPSSRANP